MGVPLHVARVLTYPQRVFGHNLSQLRQLVLNGPDAWPGANYVESSDGNKRSLKFGDRRRAASELKVGIDMHTHMHIHICTCICIDTVGDVMERHICMHMRNCD